MKSVIGMSLSDGLCGISQRYMPDKIKNATNISCEALVDVNNAFIEYGDMQNPHRPYLRILGSVDSVIGNFPYDVGKVRFQNKPQAAFLYEFTDDELGDLCKKGLFSDGFEVPKAILMSKLSMPVRCDCVSVEIDGVPITFVDIENRFSILTSSEKSGYELSNYFEAIEEHTRNDYDDNKLSYEDDDLFDKSEPTIVSVVTPEAESTQQPQVKEPMIVDDFADKYSDEESKEKSDDIEIPTLDIETLVQTGEVKKVLTQQPAESQPKSKQTSNKSTNGKSSKQHKPNKNKRNPYNNRGNKYGKPRNNYNGNKNGYYKGNKNNSRYNSQNNSNNSYQQRDDEDLNFD